MKLNLFGALLAIAAAALVSPASAATAPFSAQNARLDVVARYVTEMDWCERLGYSHFDAAARDRVAEGAAKDALGAGMPADAVTASIAAAFERNIRLLKIEIGGLDVENTTGPALKQGLAVLIERYAADCAGAAKDPLFAREIVAPSVADAAQAKINLQDGYLAPFGAASWQTPAIFARGELLFGVGTCRKFITAARFNQLTAGYLGRPEPADRKLARVNRYYDESYQTGVDSAASTDLDAGQCATVLAKRATAAGVGAGPAAPAKR